MTKIFVKLVVVLSFFIGLLLPIYLPLTILSLNRKKPVSIPDPILASRMAISEIVFNVQKRELIRVAGKSMEPFYTEDDALCLNTALNDFEKGDILIYEPVSEQTLFIKRLYGLPGEKVIFENQEKKLQSNQFFVKSENPQEANVKSEIINKEQIRGVIIFQIKSSQDEIKCLAKVS